MLPTSFTATNRNRKPSSFTSHRFVGWMVGVCDTDSTLARPEASIISSSTTTVGHRISKMAKAYVLGFRIILGVTLAGILIAMPKFSDKLAWDLQGVGETKARTDTATTMSYETFSTSRGESNLLPPEKLNEVEDNINDQYWADFAATPIQFEDNVRQRLRRGEVNRTSPDRIYYINLPYRPLRREMMESWLRNQTVPYQRIEPLRGTDDVENCDPGQQHPEGRCRGVSSLARTVVAIARDKNTTGLTIVLEDDFRIKRPISELVIDTLRIVPEDWDIIRWDCWGDPTYLAESWNVDDAVVRRTVLATDCEIQRRNSTWCGFCGGTHAQLWRGSSVDKLMSLWSKLPYKDIDCRLTTTALNSYCVTFKHPREVGEFMHSVLGGETNLDIPKFPK